MATLDSTGFTIERFDSIKARLEAKFRSSFGDSIDLSPSGVFGQLIGIFAEEIFLQNEGQEAIYYSQYWNTAVGSSLDEAAQNIGQERLVALPTLGEVTFSGTDGTVIPLGFEVYKAGSPNEVYLTDSEVTIAAGVATVAVTSKIEAAYTVLAGVVTGIVSGLTGVSSVTNASAFNTGRDLETDSEFRARIVDVLQQPGTSTGSGIRNAVLALDETISVSVTENESDVTDSEGRPPHSFEVYVFDDNNEPDANIAQAILDAKPAGIQTYGSTTQAVVDSQGVSYNIRFTRPTEVPIYVIANITGNTDASEGALYPSNGDDLVAAAILAYGLTRRTPNLDIIRAGIESQIMRSVVGVLDYEVFIGTSPAPSGQTNISIGAGEVSAFSLVNISVSS